MAAIAAAVTLKIVTTAAPSREMQRRIAAAITDKTQGGCEARVVRVERTRRGKFRSYEICGPYPQLCAEKRVEAPTISRLPPPVEA